MKRKLCILAAILGILILLAGCGGGLIGTMLRVTGVSALLADNIHSDSKIVRIFARIIGGTSDVSHVVAVVTRRGASDATSVELTPTADGLYEGSYQLAGDAELSPDDYTVVVTATDVSGNVAESVPVKVEATPDAAQ